MKRVVIAASMLALTPSAAVAQSTVAAAPAIDPARLAAARDLVDQIFPPATRAQMIQSLIAQLSANIRQGILSNPRFATATSNNERFKEIFEKFMDRQIARSIDVLQANLPGMVDALAHAYARRLDLTQLRELSAFFATPTGKIYSETALTIMSDPDIVAWQRQLMTNAMAQVQTDIGGLTKELSTLSPSGKPQ